MVVCLPVDAPNSPWEYKESSPRSRCYRWQVAQTGSLGAKKEFKLIQVTEQFKESCQNSMLPFQKVNKK